MAANSPFFFGRELWRETRIALFEQATDTRPEELKAQGVRPRVWFGERWITSIFDLFEENVRFFPALLPVCEGEDPVEVLERGDTPAARRAAAPQRHDLPLEPADLRHRAATGRTCAWRTGSCRRARRWSTSAPTPPSTTGWSARSWPRSARSGRGCPSRRPRRTSTPPPATGSRRAVYWPGVGEVPVAELVLRRLLPAAHAGLEDAGVAAADRDRLLGIIERRCVTMQNGATWQADTFHRLYEDEKLDRAGRAAADDRALPRPHARERAGPRVAAALTQHRARRAPLGRPAAAGQFRDLLRLRHR